MKRILAQRTIMAPIDVVFERLTDHEGYVRFAGVRSAVLKKAGDVEKNGKGAVRTIETALLSFDEEITLFERPNRMEYFIRKSSLPVEHHGGVMEFASRAGGTDVTWTSTIEVKTPFLSGPLTTVAVLAIRRSFKQMLKQVDDELSRR